MIFKKFLAKNHFLKKILSVLFPKRGLSEGEKLLGPWLPYCKNIYFVDDQLVGTCKNAKGTYALTFIDRTLCDRIKVDDRGEFQCAPSCLNQSFSVPQQFSPLKKKKFNDIALTCDQVCREQDDREWDFTYDIEKNTCGCGYTPVFPFSDSGCKSLL